MDNLKKESQEIKEIQENKEIKPSDNHKKLKKLDNNRNNKYYSNSNNSDIKTISSACNEKEKRSKNNPISEIISKKIVENIKAVEKQKNIRNKDIRYTNDFISQKRIKYLTN